MHVLGLITELIVGVMTDKTVLVRDDLLHILAVARGTLGPRCLVRFGKI